MGRDAATAVGTDAMIAGALAVGSIVAGVDAGRNTATLKPSGLCPPVR